mmetsp:Transcript_35434/g.36097  ORF Transcript_35434/g.36097 Transcript_35434/m.36097 type:complete len:226 (+) Transcript_35434:24-701(+)
MANYMLDSFMEDDAVVPGGGGNFDLREYGDMYGWTLDGLDSEEDAQKKWYGEVKAGEYVNHGLVSFTFEEDHDNGMDENGDLVEVVGYDNHQEDAEQVVPEMDHFPDVDDDQEEEDDDEENEVPEVENVKEEIEDVKIGSSSAGGSTGRVYSVRKCDSIKKKTFKLPARRYKNVKGLRKNYAHLKNATSIMTNQVIELSKEYNQLMEQNQLLRQRLLACSASSTE